MAPYKRQAIKTNKYDLLCDSVKKGLKEVVRQILAEGAPVNKKTNALNNTPLHWSIINFQDIEIVQMLLENGADVHAQNKCKQQPLDIAVEKNNEEVISLFLSKKSITGADLPSLVLKAAQNKNENIVKLLVDYGMKDNRSSLLVKAVYLALQSENSDIRMHLLPHCAPIFASQFFVKRHDFEYVFLSVRYGKIEFVKELLRFNFNVNVVDKNTGLSLIHAACMNQHQEIVQLLLDHGANVNAKVSREYKWITFEADQLIEIPLINRTALFIAVFRCNVPITRMLLSNGAKMSNEPYILNNACQVTCKEIVEDLVMRGFDVNLADRAGGTPLYYCMTPFNLISNWENNNSTNDDIKSEIAELLLSKGANPNAVTNEKKLTALFAAVFHGCLKTVKVLLKYDINIQHTDSHGNTALHFAAFITNREMLSLLLNHDFDVNAKNHEGFTPLHIAAEKGNEQIIELLMKNNATLQTSTIFGMTPFHWACVHQNKKNVTYFLNKNVDVNIKDSDGKTALHTLAEDKLRIQSTVQAITEIVGLLLDHKADIFAEDKEGMTPIFTACAHRNITVLEILLKYIKNRYPLDKLDNRIKKVYKDVDLLTKLKNTSDRSELIKMLPVDFFTKIFFTNKENQTLLHIAAKSFFTNAINLLIVQYKIDVNWQDDLKRTALHVAIDKPSRSVIASLLELGADINIKNKSDQTPVEYAIDVVNAAEKREEHSDDEWPNDEDSEVTLCCMHACKEVIMILEKHVIRLKAANSYVSKSNLKILSLEF